MPVMHAMLGNAAIAAVLCLLALAAGRVCRSPTVRHLLWVLVLLKLVTPPLFHIPLAVLPASWAAPPAEPLPFVGCVLQPPPSTPAAADSPVKGREHAPAWWERYRVAGADHWTLVVWIAGAAGWFIWQGRRIVRFRRRVARAEDAGPEVAAAARRIARALGAGSPPAVKTATGIGSPMLWGWGRSTVVLFPRELLARLAPEARDTLLAHELAHFLRRDHWVRVLEFVATGLYWWHPAVWLARLGIEAAEEECCDAWVVGGLAASPRRYAEALLATIDFVAELRRPCLPPGACPANRGARLLHRRLVGIVDAQRPRRLRGAAAVRAAAVAMLMIQPVLRAAKATPEVAELPPAPGRAEVPLHPSLSLRPPPTPKSAEPLAWATAPAPGGVVTALARDNEVVLRRRDGTVTALGPGKPLALAFAPNTQRLATAGPGPLVRTWDYGGNLLAEARVLAAARGIAYTPDGRRLLVLDAAGGISVLDPNSLDPLAGWSVEGPANSITCGPDSQTVAVAFGSWLDAETGWVECWSITKRQKLDRYRYSASAPVGAARISPDGRTLVLGGWNGLLTWRTYPGGELIAERQLSKGLVAAAAFSPDAGTLPLDPPPEPPPPPVEPVLPPAWGQPPDPLPSTPQTASELLQGISRLPKR
jgi:beta-lactamase regulating signal transducer with metallopeptidase domain